MSLLNIFDVAGSSMNAQSIRLNLTASNLSNAESVAGSPQEAYKARHPVFAAVLGDQMMNGHPSQVSATPGGVQTIGIIESQGEHARRYAPSHPLSDQDGYIYASNVNGIEEMTNMISASRSYQNSVEVMNTSKELLLRTLTLGE